EYWNDYNPKTKQIENVEMPTRFLIEMFCDRVAASKIYNGKNYTDAHPYEYFLRVKGKHRMHENTEAMLNKLLEMLRDEGEEKTFAYIRRMKK
nr:catalase [Ruminococcus sp.]